MGKAMMDTKIFAKMPIIPFACVVGMLLGFHSILGLRVINHAAADTVELNYGGEVDGDIVRKNESGKIPHVVVQVDEGLRVAIPQSRIGKTITDKQLQSYARAAAAAGDDAEAHYNLAILCKKNGMDAQRTFHHQRAVEIDPNHSRSRAALGYVQNGNQWIKFEDQQRRNGMISIAGRWTLPESYAREKRIDDYNDASNLWVKTFARLKTTYLKSLRSGKNVEQAFAALQAIDDPHAAMAIAQALEKSRDGSDSLELRRMYVQKLGSFKNPTSVQSLVKTGLSEPNDHIRLLAIDQLREYGAPSAVATYLPILSSPKSPPSLITAALRALNHFPDPELWPQYVDALVTFHKRTIAPGPGMQVGQNNQGGGGLAMGGKAKEITEEQRNPGAVELLKSIAPGVDFRYDQNAWRQYFANQLMGSPGDLRRDL